MLGLRVLFVCLLFLLLESTIAAIVKANKDTLILVHVLFRHGNRTADYGELYPRDPNYDKTYFPIGRGQLTNAGKVKEYNIGIQLRSRYNTFLGDQYYPKLADVRSTDVNRTKASLLLCLAGLFPPKRFQIWNTMLNWQAIPINYVPQNDDKVLKGTSCPNYVTLYQENENSARQQAEFLKYNETFNYISVNSGLNVTTFKQVYSLFFGISTEVENGINQPIWLRKVWPKTITELAIKQYYVATATIELRRLASGYLIKKIIRDSLLKIAENTETQFKKKLYLYSAHENNIAHLLLNLGVFDDAVPNYGSYVTFEIHNINGEYGFKIFYQNYVSDEPVLLTIPSCGDFCPLEQFMFLMDEYIPLESSCGN